MTGPSPQRLSPISREPSPNRPPADRPEAVPPTTSVPVPEPELTEIPLRLFCVQGGDKPFHVINPDPVVDVRKAAIILGISQDLLEKWRQRGQGPAYIQFEGLGGPIRYELGELEAYKASHRIKPSPRFRVRRVQA